MPTNIGLLPQLSGAFVTSTNSDWRDQIAFLQPAPNQTLPLDITGISFRCAVRAAAGAVGIDLAVSTDDGTLVNGGTAGTLTWAVPAAKMARVLPGSHVLDLVAFADGQQINLFAKAGPATLTQNQGVTR